MAYTPTEWSNGDVITAEKLNKIENGIDNATGYEYTESKVVLFEGEVTTVPSGLMVVANLNLNEFELPDDDVLYITFNNTEYICEKIIVDDHACYGGLNNNNPDFSNIPFAFMTFGSGQFYTENAGTYSVKIEASREQIVTNSTFNTAVNNVIKQYDEYPIKILHIDENGYVLPEDLSTIGIETVYDWRYALNKYDIRINIGAKISEKISLSYGYMGSFTGIDAISNPYFSYDDDGEPIRLNYNRLRIIKNFDDTYQLTVDEPIVKDISNSDNNNSQDNNSQDNNNNNNALRIDLQGTPSNQGEATTLTWISEERYNDIKTVFDAGGNIYVAVHYNNDNVIMIYNCLGFFAGDSDGISFTCFMPNGEMDMITISENNALDFSMFQLINPNT